MGKRVHDDGYLKYITATGANRAEIAERLKTESAKRVDGDVAARRAVKLTPVGRGGHGDDNKCERPPNWYGRIKMRG